MRGKIGELDQSPDDVVPVPRGHDDKLPLCSPGDRLVGGRVKCDLVISGDVRIDALDAGIEHKGPDQSAERRMTGDATDESRPIVVEHRLLQIEIGGNPRDITARGLGAVADIGFSDGDGRIDDRASPL